MSARKIEQPSSVAPGRPGSAVFPTNPLGEQHEGIATGRDVEWEPLVDFRRMDVSENTIHGAIAWAHGDEIMHSFGGNVLVYGRSMMKPLMMKPFTEVLDDLDWKQKAICMLLSQRGYRACCSCSVSAYRIRMGFDAMPIGCSIDSVWTTG